MLRDELDKDTFSLPLWNLQSVKYKIINYLIGVNTVVSTKTKVQHVLKNRNWAIRFSLGIKNGFLEKATFKFIIINDIEEFI